MALIYEAIGLLVNKGQGIKMIGKVKAADFCPGKMALGTAFNRCDYQHIYL